MQFQVPQFIETEDKIIGPLTLKQFLYLGAAGFMVFLLYFILELWLWIIIAGVMLLTSATLAFIKINGRPIIVFLKSALNYVWNPKIYIFKTRAPKPKEIKLPDINLPKTYKTPGKEHRSGGLKDLFDNMTSSKTAIPKREANLPPAFQPTQKQIKEKYEVVNRLTGEKQIARRIDYR